MKFAFRKIGRVSLRDRPSRLQHQCVFRGLTTLPVSPVAIVPNAKSMSIDPENQFLYVTNASAGTVDGFELDGVTGALSSMLGSPFAAGTSADFIATF